MASSHTFAFLGTIPCNFILFRPSQSLNNLRVTLDIIFCESTSHDKSRVSNNLKLTNTVTSLLRPAHEILAEKNLFLIPK